MSAFVAHPAVLFAVLLIIFMGAVAFGAYVLRRIAVLPEIDHEDFNIVQAATLTLLALLVGFSLSMAVSRYDQRKNLEENEANAIGTEFARADLVDAAVGAKIKAGLIAYTKLRLADHGTRDRDERQRIGRETQALQAQLWRLATQVAQDKPTPIGALVVAGMNDVLNSQDYSEAARINHLPLGAWFLVILIAVFGCAVQGYGARGTRRGLVIAVVPVTIALSLALIADLDSPRGGIIRVEPQNLGRLLQSLEK